MITLYKANSIGRNSKFVKEHMEKNYKENMTLEEGLNLVAECFKNNIDNPTKNSEFVVVSKDKIEILDSQKVKDIYDNLDVE